MIRLALLLAIALAGRAFADGPAVPPRHADPAKVFRYAIEVSETNLDPHRFSDLHSNIIIQGIFEAPLRDDYLARPPKPVPNTPSAMPEVSADGLTCTMRARPGRCSNATWRTWAGSRRPTPGTRG